MKQDAIFANIPELTPILATADHVDIKTVAGDVTLRAFVASMFSYYPGWIKNLYRLRWAFVRLLGMKQEGIPPQMSMQPYDVPMIPGQKAAFFTVEMVDEMHYWVASAAESHLIAYLGVVCEPIASGNRFYILTIVHYRHWTGRLYFNVIRPFHHLVVGKMAQAGVQKTINTALIV